MRIGMAKETKCKSDKEVSQTSEVLRYLQEGHTITSMEAIQMFGATRLSAIIYNLRHDGYDIIAETQTCKNRYGHITRYATYYLAGKI